MLVLLTQGILYSGLTTILAFRPPRCCVWVRNDSAYAKEYGVQELEPKALTRTTASLLQQLLHVLKIAYGKCGLKL